MDSVIPTAVGLELDARVETEIMGRAGRFVDRIRVNGQWHHVRTWLPASREPDQPPSGLMVGARPPQYSTDMGSAWLVVERMREAGYVVIIEALHAVNGDGPHWRAQIYRPLRHCGEIWADTAPLAICRAALVAEARRG